MTTTTSKYKYWGGFGKLLFLNLITCYVTYTLLFNSKFSIDIIDIINNGKAIQAYLIIIFCQFLFILFFLTQCRKIEVDDEKINFINPILPFLCRKIYWKEIEYCTTVYENPGYNTCEALWIVKDNKLVARFSSYYYSNYSELKNKIRCQIIVKPYIDYFSRLLINLGIMKID